MVVPVFDEAEVLPLLVGRLRPALDALGESYEVVVVDDGSRDATPVLLERFRRDWPQLRIVRLRANAGHQAAIAAGIARAVGAWVVTLDADLQDPPELIAEMLAGGSRRRRGRGLRRPHRPVQRLGVQAGQRARLLSADGPAGPHQRPQ